MTTIEQRNPEINQQEIIENNAESTDNNGLSLPTLPHFDTTNPTPLSPLASLASLERCISNPLVRGYSNVSVSSDNEGAHFVPFGRGHDDIANNITNVTNPETNNIFSNPFIFSNPNLLNGINGINGVNGIIGMSTDMTPTLYPNDTDGVMQIIPILTQKSKAITNTIPNPQIPVLGPLEDNDIESQTDTHTSSQIASSDLPSTENKEQNTNTNTFNVSADVFVPNAVQNLAQTTNITPIHVNGKVNINNTMLAQQLIGLHALNNGTLLPPLLQVQVPLMNMGLIPPNMPMMPNMAIPVPNMPIINPTQPQPQPQSNGLRNRLHTPVVNRVRGSYDVCVNNYMNNTAQNSDYSSESPNHSPNYAQNNSNNSCRFQRNNKGHIQGRKYVKKSHNKAHNNLGNMDVTEIIKMNLSLPVLLQQCMICKFMKHQNGSRYIQEKLKLVSNDLITQILRHIIFKQKQIVNLSEDIFGNYVTQIFFENGTREHHSLLVKNLLFGSVYRLSRSFYGCRVIQKAFDCIPEADSVKCIKELEFEERKQSEGTDNEQNVIHECIICPNANHVIQKIISLNLDIKCIQFIIDCIETNVCFYSSHIFGCRIVQNIINYYGYNNDKQMLYEMVSLDNLLHLCQSQYGNYVIQHILALTFGNDECADIKAEVIHNVFSNVMYLAKNKYGSNVVEKCLQKASDKERDYLLDMILTKKKKGVLVEMVKHKYANYVIQKLLTFTNDRQKQRLIYAIERSIPNLRSLNYGKHIMEKIKKIKQNSQRR